MNSLTEALRLDLTKHSEVLHVLLSYFGSTRESGSRAIRYQKDSSDFYLDIIRNKRGDISRAELSPKFPRKVIDELTLAIDAALFSNQERAIGQRVIFCHEKVEGYFRYGDLFQLVPVPQAAPSVNYAAADHPFFLQFAYTSSSDAMVDGSRRGSAWVTYMRLLNIFANRRIFSSFYGEFNRWVIPNRSGVDATSEYLTPGYVYPGFSGRLAEFSDTNGASQIEVQPPNVYYASTFRTTRSFQLPETIANFLDLALNLPAKEWDGFFLASSWFYHAQQIWSLCRSASYVALVSAIECLCDKPERCRECGQAITEALDHCQICGQAKYNVTKIFKELLDVHVPGLGAEKGLLYRVRSELTHGLELFSLDLEPWNTFMNGVSWEQENQHNRLYLITRLAIINWLLSHVACKVNENGSSNQGKS